MTQFPQPCTNAVDRAPRDAGTRHTRGGRGACARMAVASLLLPLALLAAACTDGGDPPLLSGMGEQAIGVRTDMSCDQLVAATREQLEAEMAAMEAGLDGSAVAEGAPPETANEGIASQEFSQDDTTTRAASPALPEVGVAEDVPTSTAAGDPAGAQAGQVVAGTNNQETAVDEADIIKTDGSRIVTLTDGVMRVVGLDGTPGVDA